MVDSLSGLAHVSVATILGEESYTGVVFLVGFGLPLARVLLQLDDSFCVASRPSVQFIMGDLYPRKVIRRMRRLTPAQ